MMWRLLACVAALAIAAGGGIANAAPYIGLGAGFHSAASNFEFYLHGGEYGLFADGVGLRGKVGILTGLPYLGVVTSVEVTGLFIPFREVPLVLTVVGGPWLAVAGELLVGASAGVDVGYAVFLSPTVHLNPFLQLRPLGFVFSPIFLYDFTVAIGVNLGFLEP